MTRRTVCPKQPNGKHEFVKVDRPVTTGVFHYNVCKWCREPRVYAYTARQEAIKRDYIAAGIKSITEGDK